LRLRAVVEYDGTDFVGWQRQSDARTVQGEIEEGIRAVTGEVTKVVGAGRTDSGVHASGQVAHFDTIWKREAEELALALNANIASDVAVKALSVAPPGFHARHSATGRVYRYDLHFEKVRSPLRRRYSLYVPADVDVDLIRDAAVHLMGSHDFAGFGRPLTRGGPTVRRIERFEVIRTREGVACVVAGNAFLRHQVRRMVGLLVDIGRGALPSDAVRGVLDREPDAPVARTLGPQGLTLLEVVYPPDAELGSEMALWGLDTGDT
jgi:tRNA pseudouridine38-40 synthase